MWTSSKKEQTSVRLSPQLPVFNEMRNTLVFGLFLNVEMALVRCALDMDPTRI